MKTEENKKIKKLNEIKKETMMLILDVEVFDAPDTNQSDSLVVIF